MKLLILHLFLKSAILSWSVLPPSSNFSMSFLSMWSTIRIEYHFSLGKAALRMMGPLKSQKMPPCCRYSRSFSLVLALLVIEMIDISYYIFVAWILWMELTIMVSEHDPGYFTGLINFSVTFLENIFLGSSDFG